MASSLLVASISTTLDEVPGILNCTVKPGKVLEGFSFTGSRGIKAKPINATHIKATISVKEEAFVCAFILEGLSIVSMLGSTISPIVPRIVKLFSQRDSGSKVMQRQFTYLIIVQPIVL